MTAPYIVGSATSKAAAISIEPNIGTLRWRILDLLRKCGSTGATDDELQSWTGINPSAQRPRRIELCEVGLVRNSGRTRRTRSGRQAVVWIATEGKHEEN